jgi:surface protein
MKGSYKQTTRRTHALARSPEIVRTTQKYAAAAKPEVTLYTPEQETKESVHDKVPAEEKRRVETTIRTHPKRVTAAISHVETRNRDADAIFTETCTLLQDATAKLASCEERISAADMKVREATERAAACEKTIDAAEAARSQLNVETTALLAQKQKTEHALQAAGTELTAWIHSPHTKSTVSVEDLGPLTDALKIVAEELNNARTALQETREKRTQAEEANAESASQIAELQAEYEVAKGKLQVAESQMQRLREDLLALESQVSDSTQMQKELTSLTSRISEIQKERSAAEEKSEKARAALQATDATLRILRANIANQEAALASCEADKQRASDEAEKANADVKRATSEGKEKDERIAQLEVEAETMQMAHTKAKTDLHTWRQKLETQEAQEKVQSASWASALYAQNESTNRKDAALKKCTTELAAISKTNEELIKAARDQETALEMANAEAEKAKTDLAAAQETGTDKDKRLAQFQQAVQKAAADAADTEVKMRQACESQKNKLNARVLELEKHRKQEARRHLQQNCDRKVEEQKRKVKEKEAEVEEQKQKINELSRKVSNADATWQSTYRDYQKEQAKNTDLERQITAITAAKDAQIQLLEAQMKGQPGARTKLTLSASSVHSVQKTDWSKRKYVTTADSNEFHDALDVDANDTKTMHSFETSLLLSYATTYATQENKEKIHVYCGACRIHDLCELMHAPQDGDAAKQVSQSARQIVTTKLHSGKLTDAQRAFLLAATNRENIHGKLTTINTDDFDTYGDIEVWDVRELTDASGFYSKVKGLLGTRTVIDFAFWDTRKVKNMSQMFAACTLNVSGLESWCTAEVTSMNAMFQGATSFNCDIGEWDTTKLTNAMSMLQSASRFNRNLSRWNTTSLTHANYMFAYASEFAGDVSSWKTPALKDAFAMFRGASKFDCNLSGWDVRRVTTMTYMFAQARSFTGKGLEEWDVSGAIDMCHMFNSAEKFDADLSKWDVTNVKRMDKMFHGAIAFSNITSVLKWKPSSLETANDMFTNSYLKAESITEDTWIDKNDYVGKHQIQLAYLAQSMGFTRPSAAERALYTESVKFPRGVRG